MTAFEVFRLQLDSMRGQVKEKSQEYVRVDAMGIEVVEFQCRKDESGRNTLLIHGFDENDKEAVFVCPEEHFSAKLTFAPKSQERKPIGFKSA